MTTEAKETDAAYLAHTLVDEWDRANGIGLVGRHREDLIQRLETLLGVFQAVNTELLECLNKKD